MRCIEPRVRHAALWLRRLGNDQDFLGDILIDELGRRHRDDVLDNSYGPQVVMLAPPRGDFFIRANIWPSEQEHMVRASGGSSFVLGLPHDHNFNFLTGLLAFLPNIGAPISGALMVLVGFSGGVNMGIYCIIVYVVVQVVDGNIIVPMVAKKTADLAPALVLGAQLIMGALFGLLGLILADPLVAMIKVALERQSERNESA